jgi:hypothetical protein
MKRRINTLYLLPSLVLLLSLCGSSASAQTAEAKIALRAVNGQYVCAEDSGGREIVANRGERREWETFILIRLHDGKVALQANNGQYVCAEGGGGGLVVANRNAIGPWESFTPVHRGDGKVALQASNGQYVCAEGGGGGLVVANRNAIGPWETFTLEILQLPETRDIEAGPIWHQQDAQDKCPRLCEFRSGKWTGQWRTTIEGRMSVCECKGFLTGSR